MEGRLENYENCARRIQSYWRSFRDRRLFRLLINTLRSAEQCPASAVLYQLSPREAELLKDPSLKCKLRFRFAGPRFPPSVVFKIFHIGGGGRQRLSGQTVFAPSNQATADSCRMMGNRVFMDLISVNEIHKAAVEPQDVICMRDYMQYSSRLDELPARLGGRENGWRFLSLKVLSRDVTLRQGVKPGTRGFCAGRIGAVLPLNPAFAGQGHSHRGFLPSTRRSARAQNTADRKRRLYGLTDTQTVLDEHMDSINNHDMKKQNGKTEKWGIKVVLPLVETEDYEVNSSESEWEEEAEKLCNWSKQLDIEAVQTPELI
ncbi:uncharacterized protein CXorf58 homolog [Siphateles boraxobius]|uniref:uncharacterized protein CXorf58 homolog n=1 Tax=Siphateles boraxobius TaxID=180520 RepID=UPI00406352BA